MHRYDVHFQYVKAEKLFIADILSRAVYDEVNSRPRINAVETMTDTFAGIPNQRDNRGSGGSETRSRLHDSHQDHQRRMAQ
jgi:hypothetical protein